MLTFRISVTAFVVGAILVFAPVSGDIARAQCNPQLSTGC